MGLANRRRASGACPYAGRVQEAGMAENGAARAQITAIVGALLAKRSCATAVGPEQNLTDAGLTSLDMVNLMLAIEDEFDVEIPQRRMTPANFRTIAAIESLVAGLAMAA
jgi:acyl carrier protein